MWDHRPAMRGSAADAQAAAPAQSSDPSGGWPRRGCRAGAEAGTGLYGTAFGIGMFLVLLLVAVQTLTHLYATTVVEAAAYDAVQRASGAGGSIVEAEAQARALLGGVADSTTFEWAAGEEVVEVRVRTERSQLVPGSLGAVLGLDTVERDFRMRREGFR